MIVIIASQLAILAVWWALRRYMNNSEKFRFNIDELHHFDALIINIALPLWLALGMPIPGLVCLAISLIAAIDDMYQHRKQTKDPKAWSPLKKLLYPIWIKAYER